MRSDAIRSLPPIRDWRFVATALHYCPRPRGHLGDGWRPRAPTTHRKASGSTTPSLEFLIGRLLFDTLNNLGLTGRMRLALAELVCRLRPASPDSSPTPRWQRGGLGRLAACFMESMATLAIPAYGYGIRYDHGLFRQVHRGQLTQSAPENWLSFGSPWEVAQARRDHASTSAARCGDAGSQAGMAPRAASGIPARRWMQLPSDARSCWRTTRTRCASGRQWASDPLRLDTFNQGDHVERIGGTRAGKWRFWSSIRAENTAGLELRLRQEYFFTAASLWDLVDRHMRQLLDHPHGTVRSRSPSTSTTHPAITGRRADAAAGRHACRYPGRAWRITTDTDLLHQPHAAAGPVGRCR